MTTDIQKSDGQTGHTDGPWEAEYGTDGYFYVTHDCGLELRGDANARLIASAPNLLDALRDLLGEYRNDENGACLHCGRDNAGHDGEPCSEDCPGERARAAIYLATGATA